MEKKLFLTKKAIIGIAIYYSVIFFATLVSIIYIFSTRELQMNLAYLLSSLSALLSSSIYYVRKLYKSCFIEDKVSFEQDFLKQFASIVYFITRPFFAVAFSILIIFGIKGGFIIISSSPNSLDTNNFIYTCSFLSFIAGFRTGSIITKLENVKIKPEIEVP